MLPQPTPRELDPSPDPFVLDDGPGAGCGVDLVDPDVLVVVVLQTVFLAAVDIP